MKFLVSLLVTFWMLSNPALAVLDGEVFKETSWYVRASNSTQATNKTADALVISCIDCRFRDEVARFLQGSLGLTDRYDETALPGASLAYLTNIEGKKIGEANNKSINATIDFAHKHHKIERVIFLDHMDCGAYKETYRILEEKEPHQDQYSLASNPARYLMHHANLQAARTALQLYTNSQKDPYNLDISTLVLVPNSPGTTEVSIFNTEKVAALEERPLTILLPRVEGTTKSHL